MPRYRTPYVGRPFDQPVTHTQLNDNFQAGANAQSITVTWPLTIQNTLGGGTRIGINLPPMGAAVAAEPVVIIKQFRIVIASDSDVLRCVDYTGGVVVNEDGEWVAKDWFLRGAETWDGVTRNDIKYSAYSNGNQTRVATKSGETEDQTIVPAYKAGDIIVAFRVDTGVIVPGTEGDDEPTKVEWIEPAGARMWQVIT